MTAEGFHSADGVGLGLFAILDEEGDYGVGVALVNDDPRASGAEAIQKAIINAGRPGEPPDLVWINGVPGHEEAVLTGIQDVLGPDVPIAGGSSADNTVEGYWQQFADGQVYTNAVIVTAMYPSTSTYLAFHSGYSPTETKGRVTKSQGAPCMKSMASQPLMFIMIGPVVSSRIIWTGAMSWPQLHSSQLVAKLVRLAKCLIIVFRTRIRLLQRVLSHYFLILRKAKNSSS